MCRSHSKSMFPHGSVLLRTVGVFRCVLESTISKKSAAVGTGAMAFMPLVDVVDILVLYSSEL